MKTFVLHWNDLAVCLPIGNALSGQGKRMDLFNNIDGPDGKGILGRAKLIRAIYRSLPTITGIPDTKPFLTRAFKTTVNVIPPVARIGTDNLDRNQFRSFLIYIWYYMKIWELLLQNQAEVKGHLTLPEFDAALAWLQEWGFKDAEVWDRDPAAAFNRFSGGNSVLPVEEFIDHCLSVGLRDLCLDGEENERDLAIRLLQRTHPHVVDGNPQKKWQGLTFIGSSLPVPPPGQKRPPPEPVPQTLVKPNTFKRWSTQYMCDYESPSRLASQVPSASVTAAPSRGGQGHATPALRRAESLPAARQTLSGLDRDALRSKLENHLAMNTTSHMRKLLQVAGGMSLESPQSYSPTKRHPMSGMQSKPSMAT